MDWRKWWGQVGNRLRLRGRLAGVDVARGLAMLGMGTAHLRPHGAGWEGTAWLALTDGRSSALFAFLAGTSLALSTRRLYDQGQAADDGAWRARAVMLVKRAVFLFALGWALTALRTPIAVILSAYAVCFLLILPVWRARPQVLLALAAFVFVVVSPLVQAARLAIIANNTGGWVRWPPLAELLTGTYPALSWVGYLLVGLAVARWGWKRWKVQLVAAAAGGLLLGLSAFVAWEGRGLEGLTTARAGEALTAPVAWWSLEAHSDSPVEMLSNLGGSLLVVAGLVALCRWAVVRGLTYALACTGVLSLSVYTAHLLTVHFLGNAAVWDADGYTPLLLWGGLSLGLSTLWWTFLGAGPLERLLRVLQTPWPGRAPVPAAGSRGIEGTQGVQTGAAPPGSTSSHNLDEVTGVGGVGKTGGTSTEET